MKKYIFVAVLSFWACAVYAAAFQPSGENVSVSASSTSAVATFGLNASIQAPNVVIYNATTSPAVVLCGPTSSVTAVAPASGTLGGFLIPPGFSYEIYKGNTKYCAVVLTTGSGTVYFSPGLDVSN